MLSALKRFGLPDHVLCVIQSIYTRRMFRVKDCEQLSQPRRQLAGISQGCPLSPFLFVMLMSVLMVDAVGLLSPSDQEFVRSGSLAELLYADDTLLLSADAQSLQRFLRSVSAAGATYGLELHWGKLQLMRVRCEAVVRRPDHAVIEAKEEITYLGSLVSADGRSSRELVRRIALARAEFRELSGVWRHSSLGRRRKLHLFYATVVHKTDVRTGGPLADHQ